jgi:hypothetical protein
MESLRRQETYGVYDTTNLSILLLAFSSTAEIVWDVDRKIPDSSSDKDDRG